MKKLFGFIALLSLLAVVPVATAQSYNPTPPGNVGGWDSYYNQYPIYGKQYFQTGSWSFLPSCFVTNSPNVTISIATPGVITVPNNCVAGQAVVFATSSALPTGLTAGTTYYVIAAGLTTNAFEVSTSAGGSAVNTSGSQSGVQSVTTIYTNGLATTYTAAMTLAPVPPGLVVPGHCVLWYQSTNASGTITLAASVSSTSALLQTLNSAHTGSGGATLADIATTISATTATAISSTIGGGTANTTYGDRIDFTLTTSPTQTAPTTVTLYAQSSSASYTVSLQPGSYCVTGF